LIWQLVELVNLEELPRRSIILINLARFLAPTEKAILDQEMRKFRCRLPG